MIILVVVVGLLVVGVFGGHHIRKRMAAKRKAEAGKPGDQTLGQRIRTAREARGESQVNLAATAGISQGYLSQLETDEREPTLSITARLARSLGISLDELASTRGGA